MTWTRLDDSWTESPVLADLSLASRWHYLAMIQVCSRTGRYDGVLRSTDARRASDVEDPAGALAELAGAGLIVPSANTYKLVQIDDHIPSPSVRENSARTKVRMQRSRAHKNGDHSACFTDKCPDAPPMNGPAPTGKKTPSPSPVTGVVTRNTGTGQDGTGQAWMAKHSEDGSGQDVTTATYSWDMS